MVITITIVVVVVAVITIIIIITEVKISFYSCLPLDRSEHFPFLYQNCIIKKLGK
jgi:hypothetical protein